MTAVRPLARGNGCGSGATGRHHHDGRDDARRAYLVPSHRRRSAVAIVMVSLPEAADPQRPSDRFIDFSSTHRARVLAIDDEPLLYIINRVVGQNDEPEVRQKL